MKNILLKVLHGTIWGGVFEIFSIHLLYLMGDQKINPNWLLRAISTLGRDIPEQYFETKSHCTRRAILPALQNPVVRVSNQMLGHGWHNKLILYPLSNTWLCLEFSHVIPIQLYGRSKCQRGKNPWGQLREGENFFLSIFFYQSHWYNVIFVIVFRLIAKLSLLNHFFMAKNMFF